MNDLLSSCRIDLGMSGGVQWKPLVITQQEYANLVRELRKHRPTLRTIEAAPWVKTMSDWSLFLDETFDGIPAAEHKKIVQKVRTAEKARDDVLFYGKKGNITELSQNAILANIEWSKFRKRYKK
jgi:hypothetical protein